MSPLRSLVGDIAASAPKSNSGHRERAQIDDPVCQGIMQPAWKPKMAAALQILRFLSSNLMSDQQSLRFYYTAPFLANIQALVDQLSLVILMFLDVPATSRCSYQE
jgi:hypothetical protein